MTFLGYDPNEKKSFFKMFSMEFEPKNFENLENIYSIKSLKMVAVDRVVAKYN